MPKLPSLIGLQAFDLVSRESSFSRAARRLHLTQGAVSHRIRNLEEELGVRLFHRSARRVQLTEAGHRLALATREGFERIERGVEELRRGHQERLTVSCSPSFAIRFLLPHLPDLQAQAPELEILISASDTLVTPGASGIDLCIRFGAGDYRNVDAMRLTEEALTPVCSPLYAENHGLTHREDLRHCTLLHDEVLADHPDHVGWAEWLDRFDVEADPSRGLRFSHAHLALDAAASGMGVALARRSLGGLDLAHGRLIAPFPELELPSPLTYWLIKPKRNPSDRLPEFEAWLRQKLED